MDRMSKYQQIVNLAAQLPSGEIDPKAQDKLDGEFSEFLAELPHTNAAGILVTPGDKPGALTKLADVAYYVCKLARYRTESRPIALFRVLKSLERRYIYRTVTMFNSAFDADLTVDNAYDLAIAKYILRAAPGNPKNDDAERTACMAVVA